MSGEPPAPHDARRGLWIRIVLALFVGLVEPGLELAWKCRAGFETSEACVWGRSLLPLGRVMALVIIAPATFGVLTLVAHLWRARRSRD